MTCGRPSMSSPREATSVATSTWTLPDLKSSSATSLSACDLSPWMARSEEHTSELQSQSNLVCRLLLEKKKKKKIKLKKKRKIKISKIEITRVGDSDETL